jgi:hypothetical protein
MLFIFSAIAFTLFWFMNNLWNLFHLRMKPFTCESCLGVWVALIFYFIPNEYLWIIFGCFTTGVVVPIMLKLIPKILK